MYDVVGVLAPAADAGFTVYDGATLEARLTGTFAAPPIPAVTTDGELATCNGCYRITALSDGVLRVQLSHTGPWTRAVCA